MADISYNTKHGNKEFIFQNNMIRIVTGITDLKILLKYVSKMVRYLSDCARDIKCQCSDVYQEHQDSVDSSTIKNIGLKT